ncbi:hypothetical protein [Mesorhizobium sp. M9A.F.Ca.ET.002.03.1.2]|uniref:hypothetical protein n=1 Tax=Mesorhizobium sp. M9A.F.Ca.ET.002.03.1.2 TaxID=2493668 RepID=UPI001675B3EA|nr:hypothetical protein [Mesorhizobium sp. M9A.F.Ca.ET.002.03.1.2]
MRYDYSAHLCRDVDLLVWVAARSHGIVNVTAVAEAVRLRNLAENLALEDIECLVLQAAQFCGAPMEFDSLTVFESGDISRLSGGGSFDVLEDGADFPFLRQPGQTQQVWPGVSTVARRGKG